MRPLVALLLCLSACHPIPEVHAAEPGPPCVERKPTPEEVLTRMAGELEAVIAEHTGFPPGHESNVRMAFEDVLAEVHSNIPNVRP